MPAERTSHQPSNIGCAANDHGIGRGWRGHAACRSRVCAITVRDRGRRGGGRCPELVQEGFVFYRINMLAQGPYRIGK